MSRTVEIKRSGATAKDDPNCFNRLHWALPPVAKASPGDYIVYETRDALDDSWALQRRRPMSQVPTSPAFIR